MNVVLEKVNDELVEKSNTPPPSPDIRVMLVNVSEMIEIRLDVSSRMSGWSVSVYPLNEDSCATNFPDVEIREWLDASVTLLPLKFILLNRRVDDASSEKSVWSNEEDVSCLIVNPVIVNCTPEMEKKGVDEQVVMEKVSAEEP